jgi:8-oxo-dGTP diphosphatase
MWAKTGRNIFAGSKVFSKGSTLDEFTIMIKVVCGIIYPDNEVHWAKPNELQPGYTDQSGLGEAQTTLRSVYKEDKIFLCRRKPEKSLGGYWEFPGGKVEAGEHPEDALTRELLEELAMEVQIDRYFGTSHYDYPDFSIELIAYCCTLKSSSFILTDHDAYAWVLSEELLDWKLSPADVGLVVGKR